MAKTQERLRMKASSYTPLSSSASLDMQLFARRAVWVRDHYDGKDISFLCGDFDNNIFYCKGDNNNRPVRATELIFTLLADRLGIRTAPWSIIEYDGETFFGSRHEITSFERFACLDFLMTPRFDEIGRPSHFPGEYLAQLLAFDMFINNPDRGTNNFLFVNDGSSSRLCAIDFADGRLADIASDRFLVANTNTIHVGRRHRQTHGTHVASAIEMVDRIEALPATGFSRIVDAVPEGWLDETDKGGLCESWGSPSFKNRLMLLRAGLTDGSLV